MNVRRVRRYVLDAQGEPRPEPNFSRWLCWCRQARQTLRIAADLLEGDHHVYEVMTLFLCYDRAPEQGVPLLYRTSILTHRGEPMICTQLYASRGQAIVGHHDAVRFVKELLERERTP